MLDPVPPLSVSRTCPAFWPACLLLLRSPVPSQPLPYPPKGGTPAKPQRQIERRCKTRTPPRAPRAESPNLGLPPGGHPPPPPAPRAPWPTASDPPDVLTPRPSSPRPPPNPASARPQPPPQWTFGGRLAAFAARSRPPDTRSGDAIPGRRNAARLIGFEWGGARRQGANGGATGVLATGGGVPRHRKAGGSGPIRHVTLDLLLFR